MGRIILNSMQFRGYHGCYEFEKKEGNDFSVDLILDYDSSRAEKTDKLVDSLDYEEVFEIVKKEMETSADLLESLARRIINKIKSEVESILAIKIKICKLNPPVNGQLKEFCFELEESVQ